MTRTTAAEGPRAAMERMRPALRYHRRAIGTHPPLAARALEYDESGYPIERRESSLADRVRRMLVP